MPPRGVKSAKRKRQYQHIKASAKQRGASTDRAEEIAARTVNKQRREAGQTRNSRKKPASGGRKKASASRTSSGSRKTSSGSRKTTSGGGKKK
jgi:hypothetical protein